jgi:hypothetical protein
MRLLLFVTLAACAQAGAPEQGGHTDGGLKHPDGNGQQLDAYVSHVDAPPGQQTKTLSETTSQTIKANTSVACPSSSGVGTAANNFYRVFDLATFGITTDFHVTQISFQVEDCESIGGNGTVVQAQVGTYNGTPGTTLTLGSMTVLATNSTVQVPEVDETASATPGGTVNVPLNATIPAGGKVFIEVDVPDGAFDHQFYMGANDGGQMGAGYILNGCSGTGTSPKDIGMTITPNAQIDLLMTVTGTY